MLFKDMKAKLEPDQATSFRGSPDGRIFKESRLNLRTRVDMNTKGQPWQDVQ